MEVMQIVIMILTRMNGLNESEWSRDDRTKIDANSSNDLICHIELSLEHLGTLAVVEVLVVR